MAEISFITSNGNNEESRKLEAKFDFGTDINDAIEKFGGDVVFDNFVAAAKVDVQSMIRRKMNSKVVLTHDDGTKSERDYTDEEILVAVAEWKPSKKGVRQSADPLAKAEKLLGSLDAAGLEALKAKLAALTGGGEAEAA